MDSHWNFGELATTVTSPISPKDQHKTEPKPSVDEPSNQPTSVSTTQVEVQHTEETRRASVRITREPTNTEQKPATTENTRRCKCNIL
jgi:hypothetical protein